MRRELAQSLRRGNRNRRGALHARCTVDNALHLKVLRSPHAHARIKSIKRDRVLAVPGVVAVFTFEDVPRKLYSTATHEDHLVDPDDTYILDDVVRFVGQRVAAGVAETEGVAEKAVGCSRLNTGFCRRYLTRKPRWSPAHRSCTRKRVSPIATMSMSTFLESSAASSKASRTLARFRRRRGFQSRRLRITP
jgi:Aldehyde oxidase and xanthine dehydrogenase, a/b hammerhead domain